jgi:transposase
MPRAYSLDLRQRVIEKRRAGKNVTEIITELNVSKTFVYDMIALEKETGEISPRKGKPGRKASINETDLERMRLEILKKPDITLEELKETLKLNVAISTICDAINYRLDLRYKKNSSCNRTKQA